MAGASWRPLQDISNTMIPIAVVRKLLEDVRHVVCKRT